MKCVVLAGGIGERLWPLSRKKCPKQFIKIENNHSIFQDTIARNIPFCDEFIIVTNEDYKYLVENQLEPFRGLNYRCIYESVGKKTTAAIVLACLSVELTEYVFVTNTNLLISEPEYKDAIIRAKHNAYEGYISILVNKVNKTDKRYGYVIEKEKDVVKKYVEKPQEEMTGELYKNLGFLIFQNGIFLKAISKRLLSECKVAYETKRNSKGDSYYGNINVTPIAVEKAVLEKVNNLKIVEISFSYHDIRTIEDLIGYNNEGVIINDSNSQVINSENNKAIVINNVDDLKVINTKDALYIGKSDNGINEILKVKRLNKYLDEGVITYRLWGNYEDILIKENYRLRQVTINIGKTVYEHVHKKRVESWTIIKGEGKFTINGNERVLKMGDSATAGLGDKHQISNIGECALIIVETSIGEFVQGDMTSTTTIQLNEKQLGVQNEPMIKLKPVLKDYLWGGEDLIRKYGFESDLDIVAEVWELSAHHEGDCIVASGRHKGMAFSKYIETVGKEILGWKCLSFQSFPILIKLIDANRSLSIQVHPDDDYALEYENQYGKNEMWYVIDSKPGAGLYIGFNRDVDASEVTRRIEDNSITEVLNFYTTKPGDIFFVPAGTVHAICEGNMICEIQQSSSSTYRIYDYNRKDKFGNTRELHIDKALEVMSFQKYDLVEEAVCCKYFETEIVEVVEKEININDDGFLSVICIEGSGKLSINGYNLDITAGESVFISAQKDVLYLRGPMKLVICHI